MAVVGRDIRRFVTDFRYVEQAGAAGRGLRPRAGAAGLRSPRLTDGWPDGRCRLGFEDQHVTVRRHARLRELLPERIELVPAGGVVEALRAVKEPEEIARIARRRGARRRGLRDCCASRGWWAGPSARSRFALENEMRRRGAEPSFPSIVASGRRGALPHAAPADVPIARGTLVTLDIGARLDGYCSDCTRTWATGELPDDLAEVYELVRRAQEAALAAVRPGPEGREVDAVARDIIDAAGHGEHFGHGLGHGVGLEVHEAPRLARTGEARLVAGNVVTVEPGVYLPGRGGVRIEDLVVVTEDGHRVLSRHHQGPDHRRLGPGTRLKPRARHADTGGDGTPSPHPPNAAPRRPDGRAGRAPGARSGHGHRGRQDAPVVKRVTPKHVFVGETLTIRGQHFRRGVNKNMVAFKRRARRSSSCAAETGHHQASEGRAAQAAREGPARPERHAGADAAPGPRALRALRQALHEPLEVAARRPREAAGAAEPKEANPNGDCDGDGQINRVDTDDDNDLLSDDARESARRSTAARRTPTATGRGRLRVPVGARPQRRRAPGPNTTSRTREAAVPEPARRARTPAPTTTATT